MSTVTTVVFMLLLATSHADRKFNVPAINVHAKSYHKLVNFNSDQTKEPPAIRHLTNVDIQKIREEKLIMICITPVIIKLWSATLSLQLKLPQHLLASADVMI